MQYLTVEPVNGCFVVPRDRTDIGDRIDQYRFASIETIKLCSLFHEAKYQPYVHERNGNR